MRLKELSRARGERGDVTLPEVMALDGKSARPTSLRAGCPLELGRAMEASPGWDAVPSVVPTVRLFGAAAGTTKPTPAAPKVEGPRRPSTVCVSLAIASSGCSARRSLPTHELVLGRPTTGDSASR